MTSEYHKNIQKGILLFGKKLKNILNVHKESNIYIHHITKSKILPLTYKPDVIFHINDKSKYVFQILDSQASKKREILADMFRACLSSDVSKIFFITNNKDIEAEIRRTWEIITSILSIDFRINDKRLPLLLTIPISYEIASNPENVELFISDLWKKI